MCRLVSKPVIGLSSSYIYLKSAFVILIRMLVYLIVYTSRAPPTQFVGCVSVGRLDSMGMEGAFTLTMCSTGRIVLLGLTLTPKK